MLGLTPGGPFFGTVADVAAFATMREIFDFLTKAI